MAPLAPVTSTCTSRPGYGRRAPGDALPCPHVERYDLAIVGAGIVGLASARELLARRPGLRVAVRRRRRRGGHRPDRPQLRRHPRRHLLQARIAEGAACASRAPRGSTTTASSAASPSTAAARSSSRCTRASSRASTSSSAAGAPTRCRACAACAPRRSPSSSPTARASPALHSPNTGIVDFGAVARAMADDVRERGRRARRSGAPSPASRATTAACASRAPSVTARHAVFCAGGQASRLAVAAGAPQDPRIVPFRGQYLSLRPHARGARQRPHLPGARPGPARSSASTSRATSRRGPARALGDARRRAALAGDVAAWRGASGAPGCTSCAWRPAGGPSSRPARATCPSCGPPTSRAARPGSAPRRSARDGALVDDFVLSEADATLHVRNAPSPAATSSLALGELIADRALAFAE